MFKSKISNIIILLSILTISYCLEKSSILLLPFKSKGLLKEDDQEDWIEPYQGQDEEDWPYKPSQEIFNETQFINKYFYNGMYILTTINKRSIESYINMENSKLSIDKCNKNRIYTESRDKAYYKPLSSDTYQYRGNNMGNDVFTFIGDIHYKINVQIGNKGNGLDFYFNQNNNGEDLCGNFGFNMNTNLDKTNLISQLKKNDYINGYIWTLKYLLEDEGTIILGTLPHFYQNESYLMSQYCELKAIPNQSPETAWSFQMDEVRITQKTTSSKIYIFDKKVDFLPDRGLIIGTDEYKKKIDNLIFNDLINKGICYQKEANFYDIEKNTNEIYYVYYCNKDSFIENKYTIDKTYYNTFPSLEFYIKESNMTFTLSKEHLFHEIFNRVYFLVVFKNSVKTNNIWKLGEPFFSHFQFTFDQEKKIIGFYNPVMPRIKNEEYMKNINNKSGKNVKSSSVYYIITICLLLIIAFAGGAYFLGKKLNENRKKRANELNDEDFEYSSSNSINSTDNESEGTKKV